MLNGKYGLWIVNDIKFDNKNEALLYATQTKSNIKFWYHDEAFQSVDKSLLGKISLNQLYKERAQQLRDNYDYLILHYSGGADSHNILKTFIDNNIKLDEICTYWPKALIDKEMYQVNNVDTSSKNILSEWNYCVLPVLNLIRLHYPNIKITVNDWTPTNNLKKFSEIFEKNKYYWNWSAALLTSSLVSDTEREMLHKGKTVANINGIDKPLLYKNGKKVFTGIIDRALLSCVRSEDNPKGGECFYWSDDMPLLLLEQSYQLFLHYNLNKNLQQFLFSGELGFSKEEKKINQSSIAKKILYDTWDYRFQVGKKENSLGTEMYSWFYNSSELYKQKEILVDNILQNSKLIDKEFLVLGGTIDDEELYLPEKFGTYYYIGELD